MPTADVIAADIFDTPPLHAADDFRHFDEAAQIWQ